jgi:hypothetical protein
VQLNLCILSRLPAKSPSFILGGCMSLFTVSYGTKIGGVVDIGPTLIKNASSLGNVIALFKANIDKSHFVEWLNIDALQKANPNRIQIVESTVSFTGPVAILQAINSARIALAAIAAAASAFLFYNLISTTSSDGNDKERRQWAACTGAIVGGGIAYFLACNFLKKPGVYFY